MLDLSNGGLLNGTDLHNVTVASRLEKIVTFTVSAAVTDGLLSENRFPFSCFSCFTLFYFCAVRLEADAFR